MSVRTRDPRDRHTEAVERLRAAVLGPEGLTYRSVREAAARGPLPHPWAPYVAKVHDASYRIGDAEIAELKEAGHDQEEIFEITVAAALGAALHRLDAGLRAMDEGP